MELVGLGGLVVVGLVVVGLVVVGLVVRMVRDFLFLRLVFLWPRRNC